MTDTKDIKPVIEVREHLLLGITYKGAEKFMAEELHIRDRSKGCISFMPCCTDIYTQWKSAAHCRKKYGYAEPGKSGAWIPQAYGDKLVCYELNEMMKIWLEKNNAKDKSVLEVLTEDPKYQKKYKRYVGKAKAFLSHAQLEHPADLIDREMKDLDVGKQGLKGGSKIWIDCFSLRLCAKGAFITDEVVEMVAQIGWTGVGLDPDFELYQRTFCLLETYATVKAKKRLYMMVHKKPFFCQLDICPCITCLPCCYKWPVKVDSEKATTRAVEENDKIHEYIKNVVPGGHAKLNQIIERNISGALRVTAAQQVCACDACICLPVKMACMLGCPSCLELGDCCAYQVVEKCCK